ncbi:MAG TPA: hypothetical protein VFB55_08825 [Verrucomicrobiae bacterium]|nr:hypothetical protein [Verrucomicrobiae bacterium]
MNERRRPLHIGVTPNERFFRRSQVTFGRIVMILLQLGIVTPFLLQAEISSHGSNPSAIIQNHRIRLVYHLENGRFDFIEVPTGKMAIQAAHSEVGEWSSSASDCQRTAKISWVTNELGTGQRLTVNCVRPDGPTLITEFTIYNESSFVVLRQGLKNTLSSAVRVKQFYPLKEGIVFPGETWTDIRSLNGDSASAQTQVTHDQFRSSANNLLLTFKQAGQRRSLVLGGLKTADFTKWVQTTPPGGHDPRWLTLARLLPGAKLVSYLDCGPHGQSQSDSGPVIKVGSGQSFTFPAESGDSCYSTVLFGDREISFDIAGLNPDKDYAIGFSWWDYDANGRTESVIAVGSDHQPHVLFAKRTLPQFSGRKQPPAELAALLPSSSYTDGTTQIRFLNDARVSNAVASEIWLWELGTNTTIPSEWAEGRPVTKDQSPDERNIPVVAALEGSDPIGRLVDAGSTYLPKDSFYVDCGTPDPFSALEKYGRRLARATHAHPHFYDFPTVCAWYVGVWHTPGAQNHPEKSKYRINTTTGLVEEMDYARASGFLRYSRVAGRLVPDTYEPLNPQGWWNDAHWRQFGYYVAPYDTSRKFGRAMHERGGLAFIYIQPTCLWSGSRISRDFREQHTDWLCSKDVHRTLDYTNPRTQQYLRKTFGALRGNIDGLMVDYCDDLWVSEASKGGFYDPHASGASFYRTFFKLIKNGLGTNSWLHERNLNQPDNDLTLGIVDSQRISWDTDKITPDMVSRGGLRWYKNRVVLNYDMDSKDLYSSWKVPGFNGSDEDGRRMMLTMTAIAGSRLIIANSFRDLSPEVLHDLSMAFPYYSERRSARPVDAFVRDGWPQVYDLVINPNWHQVVLYNNALPTKKAHFSVPLSGDSVDGALGLDPQKEYYVYDFWNDHFVGRIKGSGTLNQTLRPGEARMLSIHAVEPHPQFISTSRHILQGYEDMARLPVWNARKNTLSGASKVIGGETYEIVIALNGFQAVKASAPNARIRVEPHPDNKNLTSLKIDALEDLTVPWNLVCN